MRKPGTAGLRKTWVTWGWFPAPPLLFAPVTCGDFSCLASAPAHKASGAGTEERAKGLPAPAGRQVPHGPLCEPAGPSPDIGPVLAVALGAGKGLVADALGGPARRPFPHLRPPRPAGEAGRSGRRVAVGARAPSVDLRSARRPPSRAHFCGRLHKAPLFDWR